MDEPKKKPESVWVKCPVCQSKTHTKVYPDTFLVRFPLYCRKCRKEYRVDILKYAALTGYDEVVNEEIRRTDCQAELDEYEIAALDRKLQYIRDHLDERPRLTLTFFQPDKRKNGGAYVTRQGVAKKVDEFEGALILEDETVIPVQNIAAVELPVDL